VRHKLVLGSMVVCGMEEFPNIEAVQNYMTAADELNLFRYVEATSVFGHEIRIVIGRTILI
jgi:hypothetical protein